MPAELGTLWSPAAPPDAAMLAYTSGDDRAWDARILRWDLQIGRAHV